MVFVVITIPVLIAAYLLLRTSVPQALLILYVPCLLLAPPYLRFWIKGVSIDALTGVSLIFALLGVARELNRWRASLSDLLVTLLVFSAFYADAHYRKATLGVFAGTNTFFVAACPYVIGRTLIERPGLRIEFARRIVGCLLLVAVVSLWEYRMTSNLFEKITALIMQHPTEWGARQVRWGFARVAGPFGQAIVAGMVFTLGVLLQFWLHTIGFWRDLSLSSKKIRFIPLLTTLAMLLGLFMTQSRGPWIGFGIGLVIATVGRAKNLRRASVLAFCALTCLGSLTYVVLNDYTDVDFHHAETQDQQNASYRRELIATYMPLVREGGFWGWGTPFPVANGGIGAFSAKQPSIDNEYLRMAMAQGYFGAGLLILLLVFAGVTLIRKCIALQHREDVMFCCVLLGVVAGTSFTLSTVFLPEPMIQLLFLVFGWVESIRPTVRRNHSLPAPVVHSHTFRRVFV